MCPRAQYGPYRAWVASLDCCRNSGVPYSCLCFASKQCRRLGWSSRSRERCGYGELPGFCDWPGKFRLWNSPIWRGFWEASGRAQTLVLGGVVDKGLKAAAAWALNSSAGSLSLLAQMLRRVRVDLFPERRSRRRAATSALSGIKALHVQ